MIRLFFSRAIALAVALGCASCSSNLNSAPPYSPPLPTPGQNPVAAHIKHIVFIVQENRSFENMFAGWPGADAPMTGYRLVKGKRTAVPLKPMTYAQNVDMCHVWLDAMNAYDNGRMDGFNRERSGACGPPLSGDLPYRYMDHKEIAPYRTLASQYVLADHMFPTEFGTSFTAHQDLIAGTTQIDSTHSLVDTPTNFPWGCDAPAGTQTSLVNTQRVVTPNAGPFPCFTQYKTIADLLDPAHVSWRYYVRKFPIPSGNTWDAFDAIKRVRYGAAWKNVQNDTPSILSDPGKGNLAQVSWVIPDTSWADYPLPLTNFDAGPSWVGNIVNAIGKSKYWNDTAIVVIWDDWGGFYDNVTPPQLDYVGLAIRVPCLIISPYARKGFVSHTQYEYGSLLKFVEEANNLGSLNTSDARANPIDDAFDFTQAPRAFVPITTKYPPSYFFNANPSLTPPDPD